MDISDLVAFRFDSAVGELEHIAAKKQVELPRPVKVFKSNFGSTLN